MRALIYNLDSAVLVALLFLSMLLAIELGYRIGIRRATSDSSEWASDHINTIQTALFGFLALLLGFTFSLLVQRFDARSAVVVEEANAIGTTYLRAGLLPAAMRDQIRSALRSYIDLRVEMGVVSLSDEKSWTLQDAEANRQLDALWRHAERAAQTASDLQMTASFIEALNEAIDSYGKQRAILHRRLPGVAIVLLYAAFFAAGMSMGYAAGIANRRPSLFAYIMVTLVIGWMYIIIDLDRPQRGLIHVNQKSLVDLQSSIADGSPAIDQREQSKGTGAP